jgi:hypothetical protein
MFVDDVAGNVWPAPYRRSRNSSAELVMGRAAYSSPPTSARQGLLHNTG